MAPTQLSIVGSMLADETRSEILSVLLDGRAHTGGELARYVGVAPSTASEHLSKMLDGGLVDVEAQGRHRYFRLASEEIAQLLEQLGAMPLGVEVPGPRAPHALLYARTCYNHLAGELAVQIYNQLLANGHVEPFEDKLNLTASGEVLMADLGVDVAILRKPRQPTVRTCLDWTQRRHHLAGRAATAMLETMFERRWIARATTARSIRVTNRGRSELFDFFGLSAGKVSVATEGVRS